MKMKLFIAGLCVITAQVCLSAEGLLARPLSNSSFMGKRYMEGSVALKQYQTEMKNALSAPPQREDLTKVQFHKNYKTLFLKLFAKDQDGQVIRIREIDETGASVSLIEKGQKIKPASAQEVWNTLEQDDTLLVVQTRQAPCGFCDGTRYVIYFPEEVDEYKRHIAKFHKQHSASKEQRALIERADGYHWDEIESDVSRKAHMPFPPACCWTEVHEKSPHKFRHTCPICKGKKMIPLKQKVQFVIQKD